MKGGGKGYLGSEDRAFTLTTTDDQHLFENNSVRRLTPVECERLQGFPDNYTKIPTWNGWREMDETETPEICLAQGLKVKKMKSGKYRVNDPDGPRYKSLGNSMAVPKMKWLGERIEMINKLLNLQY